MKTIIKNGKVILPDFKSFSESNLLIEDDRIVGFCDSEKADKVIDAKGKYILPGLIDIHTHGSSGGIYASTKNIEDALIYSAKAGVTSVAATIGNFPMDHLISYIQNVVCYAKKQSEGANIAGIHLEGPFISMEKKGAMQPPSIEATVENFNKLIDAGEGLVRVMTIAPERENALEIIKEGKKRGVRMSIGHTVASVKETEAAIMAGATGATHTFNAMKSLLHRDPGVLGGVLTSPEVTCEVICDFVHLAPATVKLIYLAKGVDGMILISDSGPQTGLPDGEYSFGGFIKVVKDGMCVLKGTTTISGSVRPISYGAKNLLKLGIPINEVSQMGSYNPAKALGIDSDVGSIEEGKRADIIIVDGEFNVECVLVRGEEI